MDLLPPVWFISSTNADSHATAFDGACGEAQDYPSIYYLLPVPTKTQAADPVLWLTGNRTLVKLDAAADFPPQRFVIVASR